ncbi:MAG: hypothetical protein QM791_01745 [Ferruginibacter sp.]
MKIEHLIVQHLYNSKKVSLEGIGILHLNPSVALPAEADKDFEMPEGAISFEYNLKAPQDNGLIDFITEKTRKIKPLATSDLESYSILAKQFLNIGKPLIIEGIGTIQKSQAGNYEFTAGRLVTPKLEDIPRELKTKKEENISFESESKKDNSKRNALALIALVVVVMAGLGIYYWLFYNNKNTPAEPEAQHQPGTVTDTTSTASADTTKQKPVDSVSLKPASPVITDSNNFRIVIKEYNSLPAATKAFNKLISYGHKLELITVDSTKYRIAMPFTAPLSDTIIKRDSLRKFFGGTPFVLIK